MTKLTKTMCYSATYPAEMGPNGYHVVWDQQMPGFGLRATHGSGAAVPALEELRERNGDTEWVFPGRGRKKPRNDEDLRLHDLRHNAATLARRAWGQLESGERLSGSQQNCNHGDLRPWHRSSKTRSGDASRGRNSANHG